MSVRPRGTDRAEVIRVIRTTSLIGEGIEKDPVRYIYQYWDFDGNLLAAKDEFRDHHHFEIDGTKVSELTKESIRKMFGGVKSE